jgi:hypothetical protein
MTHVPALGLPFVVVALFKKADEPATTVEGSPFTKPVMFALKAGEAAGYVMVAFWAVTVRVALLTTKL